jgi:hypothetical protein
VKGGQTGARPRLRAAFVAAALVACACVRAAAQTEADDRLFDFGPQAPRPWHLPEETTREEAAALNARWKALGDELKSGAGEFAGTYHEAGVLRHSYLRWAPGGGFVYLYVYEHFSVLDFSYGRVKVTPTAVVFEVERERLGVASARPPSPMPRRWVAARWRLTNYFVPEKDIADFGMYVAGLGQNNEFNGPCCEFTPFFRAEPRRAPAESFDGPKVPAPYTRLMRRPVETTIKSVGRRKVVREFGLEGELYSQRFERASLTPVTFDAGRASGLKPGMLLRLADEPEGQYLKVTRVGATRSVGVLIRNVDDDGRETFYDFGGGGEPRQKEFPPVRVGARVTSAPPDV